MAPTTAQSEQKSIIYIRLNWNTIICSEQNSMQNRRGGVVRYKHLFRLVWGLTQSSCSRSQLVHSVCTLMHTELYRCQGNWIYCLIHVFVIITPQQLQQSGNLSTPACPVAKRRVTSVGSCVSVSSLSLRVCVCVCTRMTGRTCAMRRLRDRTIFRFPNRVIKK